MAPEKEGGRTRRGNGAGRGGHDLGGSGTRKDAEKRPRLVDVDPWAVLLERLLEGPEGDASTKAAPAVGNGGTGKGYSRDGNGDGANQSALEKNPG
jgi:hypothetical protein